jgi:AcrR family transcriptional regulator
MTSRNLPLEARKPPIQQRSRATVDEILTATAEVFEVYGYSAGTTNHVAKRAGVSIGTVYQYFPNKEAIAVALVERHVVDTDRRFREWVGHVSTEEHGLHAALRDYVTGMMELHSGQPRLQHILLEETPLPERVHDALLQAERRAAKTMADLLQIYPEIPQVRLEPAGYMVVQTVECLTHRFAAHPDEQAISSESLVVELVAMLEAYLLWSNLGER